MSTLPGLGGPHLSATQQPHSQLHPQLQPQHHYQQSPHQRPFLQCRTEPWAGYSVAWSPFYQERLAVASSANFGLVGNGRLHLMSNRGPPLPSAPSQLPQQASPLQLDAQYVITIIYI